MGVLTDTKILPLLQSQQVYSRPGENWELDFSKAWNDALNIFSPRPVSIIEWAESPEYCNLKLYIEQRVILRLYAGEELLGRELELYEDWKSKGYFPSDIEDRRANLKDKDRTFRETLLVIGRRGSKSLMTAMIGTYEIYKLLLKHDPHKYYRMVPGEPITVACCASSSEQAINAMFKKVEALVKGNKWLRNRLTKQGCQSTRILFKTEADRQRDLDLFTDTGVRQDSSSVVITAFSASSSSVRGRATIVVIFDELAWFQNNEGRDVGREMYEALTPSTSDFGEDGRILSLSSPAYEFGFFYEQYASIWEGGKPLALGIQLPSWEMYSLGEEVGMLPKFTLESLTTDDPTIPYGTDEWWREYGARFQKNVSQFMPPEAVDSIFENARQLGWDWQDQGRGVIVYHAHGDPAKSGDAFPLGVAHFNEDDNKVYIDYLWRFRVQKTTTDVAGPRETMYPMRTDINYKDVQDMSLSLSQNFFLDTFSFDQWNSVMMIQELKQRMAKEGTLNDKCVVAEETFTHDWNYHTFKLLRNTAIAGNLVCPPDPMLAKELNNLIDTRGRVDHPNAGPVQSKDVADVVAVLVRRCIEENTKGRNKRTQPWKGQLQEKPLVKMPLPVIVNGSWI